MVDFSSPTCFMAETVVGPNMLPLYATFLFLAAVSVFAIRKVETPKSKIALVYLHLVFLFMPIALMSTNTACGFTCSTCHNNISLLLLYSIPLTAVTSLLFGFVGVPTYYTLTSRKIMNSSIRKFVLYQSKKLKINPPDIRVYDTAKLVAFSFRSLKSKVFLSIGALEVLNRKELEAVLLHELAHIKRLDSLTKLSQKLMMFSPFYFFAGFGNGDEERESDNYAAGVQGTSIHIRSARRKVAKFGSARY